MRSLFKLILIFISSTIFIYLSWILGPLAENHDGFRIPKNIESVKKMANLTKHLIHDNPYYMSYMFSVVYTFKQAFAVPGSFFLNLLAGAFFGTGQGLTLVTVCTCIGTTICFLLSKTFARPIVERYFQKRIQNISYIIEREKKNLIFFLTSTRIIPFVPHWFLNISSPFVKVPIHVHMITVAVGLFPYNFLCVRAGSVLSSVDSFHDVFDTSTLLQLFAIGIILFSLTLLKMRNERKKSEEERLVE